jgi:hypothetical protein
VSCVRQGEEQGGLYPVLTRLSVLPYWEASVATVLTWFLASSFHAMFFTQPNAGCKALDVVCPQRFVCGHEA